MTRINIGIEPYELCDQMLLAEYRELPRVRAIALKNNNDKRIPNDFILGKGHVLYFINKGKYLKQRWDELCEEIKYRNFNTNLVWRDYPYHYSIIEISSDVLFSSRELLIDRIKQNLSKMVRKPLWTKRKIPEWV
jgi:hypothetical protein